MAFSFDIYPHFLSDILSIMGMEFVYRVTIKTALTMFSINRFVKNQSSSQIDVPNQISWGMYHHSGGCVKTKRQSKFHLFCRQLQLNINKSQVTWSLTRYLNLSIFSVDHPSCSIIGKLKCVVFHPMICLRIPLGGNSTDDIECL